MAEADVVYRNKSQVTTNLVQALMARVSDVWVEEDGNLRLFFEVLAGELEGVYLANQLLRDNIWVQLANLVELRLHGDQFGLPIKDGTLAVGTLRFEGAGGTEILAGSEVAADIGAGEVLYFQSAEDGTIPNPGIPDAPDVADAAVAGNLVAGTYEYAIAFITAEGETEIGVISDVVTLSGNSKINVTNIPIGGAGTTRRRIYRHVDGGDYKLVHEIADNATTTYLDNILAASLGGLPVEISTAERVSVDGVAETAGSVYNVGNGTIGILISVPDGISSVINTTAFTGGTDEETMEDYRIRLLDFIRAPRTGSAADLKVWAEEIDGVDLATVFANDNVGTPANGHATVRIVGPDGAVPSAEVIAETLAYLQEKDIANITLHVATFTPKVVAVTVALTLEAGVSLGDVSASVTTAITDYINSRPVNASVYLAGIMDAVYGLPGVLTLTISVPNANVTTTSVEKATAGTITVA
jgi:hypothetical protein